MAAYRRSIFLINKPFQLRFCLFVCSWLFVLSMVYPLIVYNMFEFFMQYVSLDPMGPELTNLAKTRREMLVLLTVFHVLFLGVTFLLSIFVSHRIAGPIYKLSKFFEEAKAGNLRNDLLFRRADHFRELAGSYNEMMTSIRARIDQDRLAADQAMEEIHRALPGLDGRARTSLEAALTHLREIHDRRSLEIGSENTGEIVVSTGPVPPASASG